MMRHILLAILATVLPVQSVDAGEIVPFFDPSGLSAEAEFTMINPTTLEVRLKNTSTGVPDGFDAADRILTGISWDFGLVGDTHANDPDITGGTAVTGASSFSNNFSVADVGANADISGEYGYGNNNGAGALSNYVTAHSPQATQFPGANLDGPVNLYGPQGGLISSNFILLLGTPGAIRDEIVATLTLDKPVDQADIFGDLGLARVEFGSGAFFITNPEPASLALFTLGGLAMIRRRR